MAPVQPLGREVQFANRTLRGAVARATPKLVFVRNNRPPGRSKSEESSSQRTGKPSGSSATPPRAIAAIAYDKRSLRRESLERCASLNFSPICLFYRLLILRRVQKRDELISGLPGFTGAAAANLSQSLTRICWKGRPAGAGLKASLAPVVSAEVLDCHRHGANSCPKPSGSPFVRLRLCALQGVRVTEKHVDDCGTLRASGY